MKLRDGKATMLMWDFGGQEIMHGTHQFFLTHRSLYVVLVDGRHDRGKQDAEYGLKLVRAFGGESRVLVALNRQAAHPFDVDREYLAKKYGVALEHFFRTDCARVKDNAEVPQITTRIRQRHAIAGRLPDVAVFKSLARMETLNAEAMSLAEMEAVIRRAALVSSPC